MAGELWAAKGTGPGTVTASVHTTASCGIGCSNERGLLRAVRIRVQSDTSVLRCRAGRKSPIFLNCTSVGNSTPGPGGAFGAGCDDPDGLVGYLGRYIQFQRKG